MNWIFRRHIGKDIISKQEKMTIIGVGYFSDHYYCKNEEGRFFLVHFHDLDYRREISLEKLQKLAEDGDIYTS